MFRSTTTAPLLADSSIPGVTTVDEAHTTAVNAAGWVDENWQDWLAGGLRILFVIALAVVLRALVRRMITKLVARMARGGSAPGRLGGLLVNAERRRQRSEAIGSVLRSVASFVIMGTAALTVLSVLNINLAPLLASAGVAGVAIGFGARNLVTDFLSGVFMILEDQYGVGDVVDAGVASGTVIEVGLRVTKLRGDNGEIWYVRNGEVKRIGNLSQGWATALVDVRVGYHEDLDRVRKAVAGATEEMGAEEPWNEALWEPVELLGLSDVTAESMTLQVRAKTMPGRNLAVERELRLRIKQALDRSGIRIVGGLPVAAPAAEDADPSAGISPPSALANPSSPQSAAASPLPGQQLQAGGAGLSK
ncbi:mechanosensitive ion channel family protein [Streptomyces thermolineatus]|uniref:Mechanosensitive ion channel family protein n=1 Tax=Streptomyces thermolineatus TaxID=44033 RepID=A0ABN3KRE0_9ACTN